MFLTYSPLWPNRENKTFPNCFKRPLTFEIRQFSHASCMSSTTLDFFTVPVGMEDCFLFPIPVKLLSPLCSLMLSSVPMESKVESLGLLDKLHCLSRSLNAVCNSATSVFVSLLLQFLKTSSLSKRLKALAGRRHD